MHRRIVYLINPISGTANKYLLKEKIVKETGDRAIDYEILDTRADGNYEYLRNRIAVDKITDVVVCGGDGSINAVASKLLGIDVNLGIIPMGSGNGLAFTAGIPRNIDRALEIVLNAKASFIDGLYINQVFSCMLCGLGFDAKVAHQFATEGKRGLGTYIRIILANLFSAHTYRFEIFTEGRYLQTDAYFISIANSNQFGNYFTIAPRASLGDGLLDVVIVKKMNKLLLILSVIKQVTGFNGKQEFIDSPGKKNILYFQTPSVTIHNPENAPLHVDGDPKETAPGFEFRVLPNAIRLIRP